MNHPMIVASCARKRLLGSIAICALLLFSSLPVQAEDLVREIQLNPALLEGGTSGTVSFSLAAPANVTLRICDLRGNVLRVLFDNRSLPTGTHSQVWDGRDNKGKPCGGGLYAPIIQAESETLGSVAYMPTANDWGALVEAKELKHTAKSVSFTLAEPAYGRLRIGLPNGGAIYRTLAPWQYFSAGQHRLDWDGKDTTGKVVIGEREQLYLSFDGFTLPRNVFIIAGTVSLAQGHYEQYPLQLAGSSQPSFFALHPESLLPEPDFEVEFTDAQRKKDQPELDTETQMIIKLKQESPDVHLSEAMIFIDHVFHSEYPATKAPVQLKVNTAKIPRGPHLLTVNLITTDDRIASWSQQVIFR